MMRHYLDSVLRGPGVLWLGVLLSGFSAIGCGKAALSGSAGGGDGWHELSSEHFVMATDLDEDDAVEAINEFERQYDLLGRMIFDTKEPPAFRTRVVIFDDEQDYKRFGKAQSSGTYMSQGRFEIESQPTLLVQGEPVMITRVIFLHELAHRFLLSAMGSMPVWLSEGLAEYYSTINVKDDKAVLGEQPPSYSFVMGSTWRAVNQGSHFEIQVPVAHLPKPGRLMQMSRDEFYAEDEADSREENLDVFKAQALNYGAAWAFVHLLIHGPDEYRNRYNEVMKAVTEGNSFEAALEESFRGYSEQELNDAWVQHLNRKETLLWMTDYAAPPVVPPKVRAMSPTEVHLLWVALGPRENPGKEVGTLLSTARKSGGGSPEQEAEIDFVEGLVRLHTDELSTARELLERAVGARKNEPRYLYALAKVYARPDTPVTAEERARVMSETMAALEKVASSADQHNLVAWTYLNDGRPKEAMAISQRSLELDQNCWECFDTYAAVQARLGDYEAAVRYQESAIARVPEHALKGVRSGLEDTLESYRQKVSK